MRKLFFLLLFFYVYDSFCQVNGYAQVTGISGTTLNLSNVNETYDAFVAGEKAIIIQMQDNVIGSTTDDSSFGDIGTIGSTGLYEVITIESVNMPTSLTISGSLSRSYNTGSNSSVQIITYPTLNSGGGDYTTTSDINALAWDGNVGGVIAFKVDGTLTLIHNISADGAGFKGASANGGTSGGCSQTPYRTFAGDYNANKGESIFRRTAGYQAAGRGKILNGGGGGNSHNAGGGGGGNYSAGGNGGPGWQAAWPYYCTTSAGGLGGLALSSYISPSRIFMGGGGGAAEGNDGASTGGGNGGGIILIAANTLETTTSCSGVSISANGNDAQNTSGGDGAGGGGASGSIVLQIPNYNVNASCQLTVEANGGNGGDVDDVDTHGGGGGGGMGVVIYSIPAPTTNITTNTDPGSGGANDNSGYGGSASSGGGTPGNGVGIVDNSNTPLPVELVNFTGRSEGDRVILNWSTVSEHSNDYFEIQMSRDGKNFAAVGKVNGLGTTKGIRDYRFNHFNPFDGFSYYRLKQTDYDGTYEYSRIISVEHHISFETFQVYVYPNPITDKIIRLKILTDLNENVHISIENMNGFLTRSFEIDANNLLSEIQIDGYSLQPGIYFLNIYQVNYHKAKKIIFK